jgi:ABC-2 type transport system ATP-binding protein
LGADMSYNGCKTNHYQSLPKQPERKGMESKIAIHTRNLSKAYGRGRRRITAITDLNLTVEPGQVYGFLGPNGAGKSTTIRLLMGLIRPTQGQALVFGQDVRRHPGALRQVGALIEGASFYPYLSGRKNLQVLARTAGDSRSQRIAALLEQVGLTDRGQHNVGSYSTGMKQRLGIAAALLGDPGLVILDEPTNGLDPEGIQEIRTLIRDLVDRQGRTVFLSSHLLHEVEQICDRVAIIQRGKVIREGPVAELLSSHQSGLSLKATPIDRAKAVLSEHWSVSRQDTDHLLVNASTEEQPEIVRQLVVQDVSVHEIVVQQPSLEDYFLSVTNCREDIDD